MDYLSNYTDTINTNSDADHTNTIAHTFFNTHANAQCNVNTHTFCNAYPYSHSYADALSNCDPDTFCYSYTIAHTFFDTNAIR